MSANQAKCSIAAMSRMLGVSPSGYYAWQARVPSACSQCDGALKARIQALHTWSRRTYGGRLAFMLNSSMRASLWAASALHD